MKIFVTTAVLALGIILTMGMMAPRHLKIEKAIIIHQPQEVVFAYLKGPKNNVEWNHVDPSEQKIKEIQENEKIILESQVKMHSEEKFLSYLMTKLAGENQTEVIFGMTNQMEFPKNVFFAVSGDEKKLAKSFEESLTELKVHLEATPQK